VVALAEKLGAAAGAHEAMAEVVEARTCIGGAEREGDGDGEKQGLRGFEKETFGFCGLPPIRQKAANGWGTRRFNSRRGWSGG
jgi:hypothetical protein